MPNKYVVLGNAAASMLTIALNTLLGMAGYTSIIVIFSTAAGFCLIGTLLGLMAQLLEDGIAANQAIRKQLSAVTTLHATE